MRIVCNDEFYYVVVKPYLKNKGSTGSVYLMTLRPISTDVGTVEAKTETEEVTKPVISPPHQLKYAVL